MRAFCVSFFLHLLLNLVFFQNPMLEDELGQLIRKFSVKQFNFSVQAEAVRAELQTAIVKVRRFEV